MSYRWSQLLAKRGPLRVNEAVAFHKDLFQCLEQLEKKSDAEIKVLFDAIRQLMTPPKPKKRKVGFVVKERAAKYGKAEIRSGY